MVITHTAPARVGLLGNPSDGYGGRTIALTVPAFEASVTLEPRDSGIEIVPGADDHNSWSSAADLVDRVDRFGYGTGVQLLAATVRTFVDVCRSIDHPVADRFTLRYDTTIPRQVGLAGSSALVVSALRCLSEHVGLEIPMDVLPSIALRVETEQLGITAGLQDRVVQTYGGLVSMDFGELSTDARYGVSHGEYESLDPAGLPSLFLATRRSAAEPSGNYHADLRARFDRGDAVVRDTMRSLAGVAAEGRAALRWGASDQFANLIGENMRLRLRLGPVPDSQRALVDLADDLDAPATFTGSGGAVVGAFDDDDHLGALTTAFAGLDADVIAIWPQPA